MSFPPRINEIKSSEMIVTGQGGRHVVELDVSLYTTRITNHWTRGSQLIIKLHIVTDIKVTINSIFDFRISTFGWGDGHCYILKKSRHLNTMSFQAFVMANLTVISDNS